MTCHCSKRPCKYFLFESRCLHSKHCLLYSSNKCFNSMPASKHSLDYSSSSLVQLNCIKFNILNLVRFSILSRIILCEQILLDTLREGVLSYKNKSADGCCCWYFLACLLSCPSKQHSLAQETVLDAQSLLKLIEIISSLHKCSRSWWSSCPQLIIICLSTLIMTSHSIPLVGKGNRLLLPTIPLQVNVLRSLQFSLQTWFHLSFQ